MLLQTSQGQSGSAHVVVLGNEKGGSGKSTTALHIAVALMKAGQRVATIDLDCRGTVDPATYSVTGESHYAEMVRDTRRKRRQLDGVSSDWIVVRNRLSMLGSRNKQLVADSLNDLSFRLGFRSIDGFAERVVYREFFPRGLTALDDIDEATLGTRPSMGHVTAREEVTSLLRQLKLPLDERGRRRAANRAEWFVQVDKPLEIHDILGA